MRLLMLGCAVLALAGCAAKIEAGNESGGYASYDRLLGMGTALQAAEKHCATFNKKAKLTKVSELGGHGITFECF